MSLLITYWITWCSSEMSCSLTKGSTFLEWSSLWLVLLGHTHPQLCLWRPVPLWSFYSALLILSSRSPIHSVPPLGWLISILDITFSKLPLPLSSDSSIVFFRWMALVAWESYSVHFTFWFSPAPLLTV